MDDIKNALFKKISDAGRSNEMSIKFKVLDTDELRVAMALNFMEIFNVKPQAKCQVKSSEKAVELKNQANRIFISGKNNGKELMKAWELYSKSIAIAPIKTEEISLAYANRSALLKHLHKYAECVEDVDRALVLNYPNHLKGKLLQRKIECLQILNQTSQLKNTVEEMKLWLDSANHLSIEDKRNFETKLELDISKYPKIKNSAKTDKSLPTFIPRKDLPCASEALTIKCNTKFGRHIVATRNINAGEILVIEKPYANMLMIEEVYTHCSHCLQVNWALIPCEFCIYSMYCSDKCKSEAWKQYHDIECSVTGYLLDLDYNKCNLFSMRLTILALREAGSIEKLRNDLKNANVADPDKKGFSEDGVYHSDRYISVCTLVTNTEKRPVCDLFERALKAAFILYYLCICTDLIGKKFISDVHEISMDEDAIYIGGLILRHLQIIPSNIHSYEEEREINTVEIGTSALPFCSLINHSCDPNISRCSTKEHIILYALVPIEKDSQIFDNYGSHYAVMNKYEREEKLKQFYFKCECAPCKADWPTYENLLSYQQLLKNKESSSVESALKNFNTYVDFAAEDNIENKPYLLSDLTEMIEILVKYVTLPCREVNNVVETLKRVFVLTYGNKFDIPKLQNNTVY